MPFLVSICSSPFNPFLSLSTSIYQFSVERWQKSNVCVSTLCFVRWLVLLMGHNARLKSVAVPQGSYDFLAIVRCCLFYFKTIFTESSVMLNFSITELILVMQFDAEILI